MKYWFLLVLYDLDMQRVYYCYRTAADAAAAHSLFTLAQTEQTGKHDKPTKNKVSGASL